MLTNRPKLFKQSGNYYPALGDHTLIFGIVRDDTKLSKPKVISFRSYKNLNGENSRQDLSLAPWRIGEVFEDVDDQVFFLEHINEKHVRQTLTYQNNAGKGPRRPAHDNKMKKCHTSETES